MNNNFVSVIMSTYNEPIEWIRKSIESILNQTYRNIEFIIVCDNPQNNQLINLLDEYKNIDSRIKIVYNDVNVGLTSSLNKAIKISSGDYIARMDSDDIADSLRIEKQLKYLLENDLSLIGAGVSCIDEDDKVITVLNKFPKDNEKFKKKILYNNCMPHPTWFAKAEVFKSLDGYRDINYAEDYDFILRALSNGFKLGNINEVLLQYRMRESSISNKNGLKQFVTSKQLVEAYKNNYILDFERVSKAIDNKLKTLSSKEIEKYLEASKLFSKGVKSLNLIVLIKAVSISKYYRKKVVCYVRGMF